jgi:hypothetical protein
MQSRTFQGAGIWRDVIPGLQPDKVGTDPRLLQLDPARAANHMATYTSGIA